MELPPWPCTGTAQTPKFWVQKGQGQLFEDNRMEMLSFRAVWALCPASSYCPAFMRTYRTHFSEADVFLYPWAEQFPWLGSSALPKSCITGKKLQLHHYRNMGAHFSSPGSVKIIWTGIFSSIMFWNVTMLLGEAWLLPSLSSPLACSICASLPSFLGMQVPEGVEDSALVNAGKVKNRCILNPKGIFPGYFLPLCKCPLFECTPKCKGDALEQHRECSRSPERAPAA